MKAALEQLGIPTKRPAQVGWEGQPQDAAEGAVVQWVLDVAAVTVSEVRLLSQDLGSAV